MSKESLREAIAHSEDLVEAANTHLDVRTVEALEVTIAAARAYACERCGGSGKPRDNYSGICHLCPNCAEWRRIADGGEG